MTKTTAEIKIHYTWNVVHTKKLTIKIDRCQWTLKKNKTQNLINNNSDLLEY